MIQGCSVCMCVCVLNHLADASRQGFQKQSALLEAAQDLWTAVAGPQGSHGGGGETICVAPPPDIILRVHTE